MPVVITGDIIGSSKLAQAERQSILNQLLKELFGALRVVWRRKEQLRAEIIQGDAFQVYLGEDAEGLRAALLTKCFFLAQKKVNASYRFDCRLSIGTGRISLLHPDSLAKSGGPAFDYSGRGLKDIVRTGPQLVFKAPTTGLTQAVSVALALTDELMSRWTPLQSQAVLLALTYPGQTNEWLAGRVGISRSAYSQRLRQAGWSAVQALLDYYTAANKP